MLLTDIARKARVSPATVSRAINQPHLVAPESLARIREVMRQHNYVPAPVNRRRGPKPQTTDRHHIGVWFVGAKASDSSHNWFQDHLLQLQSGDTHSRAEVRVLYSNSPNELPRNLTSERLDGLVIQGMEPSADCVAKLREVPHVWFMTRRSLDYPGDYVEPNNVENGRMAADYLKSRGHKSVAVVSTDPGYSAVVSRTEAFVARAAELGLKVSNLVGRAKTAVSYLEIAPIIHAESGALVRRLLDTAPHATGLYLPVDHFCGSFFRALREAGKSPDGDFEAILGNYNPVIYHNLDHSPAAIDINLQTLIRKVLDHLIWRIENPGVMGRIGITVSPRLLSRGEMAPTGP